MGENARAAFDMRRGEVLFSRRENDIRIPYMQTIFLYTHNSALDAFSIPRGLTALVGGGGKTTLMLRLADELCARGEKVIVTTTTHIFPPQNMQILYRATEADVSRALEVNGAVCLGEPSKEGKVARPALSVETMLRLADYVLCEADGAKKRPLKAPAPHEPVIPPQAKLVIAVAGLDGIGKPVCETAFRPERYAALIQKPETDVIAPEDVALVLAHADGQKKHVSSGMRYCVLLNKADGEAQKHNALCIARILERENAAERTVIAALGADQARKYS
jgi:probable selenium-dependent hydroxylase accessory protein YqeC